MSFEAVKKVVRPPRPVKPLPPREFLLEAFTYDPETGELRWKETRPLHHFKCDADMRRWNTRHGGRAIRSRPSMHGMGVNIGGFGDCLCNRIIVVMMGVPLSGEQVVDHKNGDPDDNQWDNLRICTQAQNLFNARRKRPAKDLPRGVYRSGNSFTARIGHRYEKKNLGSFKTPEEASAAYVAAAKLLHGDFAYVCSDRPLES